MYVREMSVAAAQLKDTMWLNLAEGHHVAEFRCHHTAWSGMDTTTIKLAREKAPVLNMPTTVYLFGPLIDAPPSHSDIVLTSLLYMETSLGELGMTCANLSIDSTWLDNR